MPLPKPLERAYRRADKALDADMRALHALPNAQRFDAVLAALDKVVARYKSARTRFDKSHKKSK